ncbi:uncharacterized protein G2W53_000808 [Senna tora]|uniref:Uncharacterized protein n=1 Tax=Senna tora TaxID=362788 RepID=A0A834XG38_9FABA|nr:uncharacterized protein G2W53_000808 [Senna tora]
MLSLRLITVANMVLLAEVIKDADGKGNVLDGARKAGGSSYSIYVFMALTWIVVIVLCSPQSSSMAVD